MNITSLLFTWVVGIWGLVLTFLVGYLLLLTLAAWRAPQQTALGTLRPTKRFLILVPAHNEETLLPTLLTSLRALEYPQALYRVHVVADNCTDRTAAVARAAGAIVHERQDQSAIGKGYALQWLLGQLKEANVFFDAAVIIDADSTVSANFLTVMNVHLANGMRAIQSHYAVRAPERAWMMQLRAAALALVHYTRPLGRMVLGGSAGLKGNGMVFAYSLFAEHRWSGSVTEDIDFHMALVLAGVRVDFAADAVVWAEMPGTMRSAQSQNVRWEQGRLQLARRYVPQLLWSMLVQFGHRNWRAALLCFDSIMEHLIPPFAILFTLTLLYSAVVWLWPSALLVVVALFLIVGQMIYLFAGLALARTPRRTYLALCFAPIFLIWKVWLYGQLLLRNLFGYKAQGWVRTARNEVT